MSLIYIDSYRFASVGLPAIGEAYQGGFYAGLYSINGNGIATHALIVAPAATGARGAAQYGISTGLAWKTTTTTTTGANSTFDGVANMNAIITAGIANHPAAEWCHNLVIGGFDDWYLPSRFEHEIAYFNLKAGTGNNATNVGINAYAVPPRASNYTAAGAPLQTAVAAFQNPSGAERFNNTSHWNSNEGTATAASRLFHSDGTVSNQTKTSLLAIRAFRRVAL
jgi:hypothetical protein